MRIKKPLVFFILTGCLLNPVFCRGAVDYIKNMPHENKLAIRRQLIERLIAKYEADDTFVKIDAYLNQREKNLPRKTAKHPAKMVLKDTFDKMDFLFNKVRPIVGGKNPDFYNLEGLERTFYKYRWLKGFCFLILGIGEEHKLVLTYFYLPGNESQKEYFMDQMVRYFYPEVTETPENEAWRLEMSRLMGRLGYQAFDIAGYSSHPGNERP